MNKKESLLKGFAIGSYFTDEGDGELYDRLVEAETDAEFDKILEDEEFSLALCYEGADQGYIQTNLKYTYWALIDLAKQLEVIFREERNEKV